MQDQKDYQRLWSLYKERLLEIKRQGIIVQLYHKHQILPAYLQCAMANLPKLQAFLDSKLSLELCDLNGMPLVKIGKKAYYTNKKDLYDDCRLYLQNKNNYRGMQQGPLYILVKNNATIGVLSQILSKRLQGDRYFHKIQDFIGDDSVTQIDLQENMRLQYQTQSDLNEQQNTAISKVFSSHLTFVKGPPGCGKTKTVSRMVKMLAERGMKVLVGSISNIANQTLINEIIRQTTQHNYLCDAYPQINMKKICLVINYSRKALQKVSEQAKFYSINNRLYYYILQENTSPNYHEDNIMEEIQKLQQGEKVSNMFWAIYMKSYTRLMADANVVISTTINSFKLYKYTGFRPDIGIVDEAAQASWTDTYGFLAFGVTRMVFVGDEMQLRPTVIGDSTSNEILKETMFEKLSQKNPNYFVHLRRQYRMHPKISQFPNQQIYDGLLINEPTTQSRQCSLEYFRTYPISFVTHNFTEQIHQSSESVDSQKGVKEFYNQYQGSLIMDFLFSVPFEEWKNIGVLTFYDMQCQVLIQSLQSAVQNFVQYGLTIRTIDGYQGGEKDYILVSTVRSNAEKNPGFCTQLNRVNVSLTRAKKGLIVFGDPQTLSQDKPSQDQNKNIWGKFHNFMLRKEQVLNYEKWHEFIGRIKQKEITRNNFYVLYMESLQVMEMWKDLASSENQILQKNKEMKRQAKFLMGKLLGIRQKPRKILQVKLKDYLLYFLEDEVNLQNKFSQDQIQQLGTQGYLHVKQKDFKQKVHHMLTESFTQKQLSFASYFIHLVSKDIYEIISKSHELREFQNLVNGLKIKINEQEHKLFKETQTAVIQWMEMKNKVHNLGQKYTELQTVLVSSKLMYDLISLYKNKIDPQVVQDQATLSNQI